MPLPGVEGWIIDYRTANNIFASQSNSRITHCISLCQGGSLFICHHEEKRFRADPLLNGPFINEQLTVFEPDEDVYEKCPGVKNAANGKALLVGSSEAAVFITAAALSRGFGVISDSQSPVFATVHDLCTSYGVPVFTADDYFLLV